MQTPREAPLRAVVWTLIEWEPAGAWFPPWARRVRSRLECGHTVDGTPVRGRLRCEACGAQKGEVQRATA